MVAGEDFDKRQGRMAGPERSIRLAAARDKGRVAKGGPTTLGKGFGRSHFEGKSGRD